MDTHILVVDDNESVRQSTAEILALAGYQVSQASGPDEVLDRLSGEHIDVVLLDLGVDRIGLRVLDEAMRLPIVILTSGIDQEFSDPRVCAFVPKPFAPDLLMAVVARCLTT
ncbi:MAG TPA: response regulator [Acidimicrobiales bacterium]|nr:response regulator [Acidimicrobiales bacterium]